MPGQAVFKFRGLIRVADAGQEGLAPTFFARQFGGQDPGKIDFDLNKSALGRLAMVAGIAAHKDGITVSAAMTAPQIRVNDVFNSRNPGFDQGGFGGNLGEVHGRRDSQLKFIIFGAIGKPVSLTLILK